MPIRMRVIKLLSFILIAAAVLSSPVLASQLKAVRVDKGPRIDGFLSDPVWQSADAFTAFRMAEPEPNQDPTEKTELRILFDDSNLYVDVFCYDGEPARIAANSLAHDSGGRRQGMGFWHIPQGPSDDIVRVTASGRPRAGSSRTAGAWRSGSRSKPSRSSRV